jgi:hypothetical protein
MHSCHAEPVRPKEPDLTPRQRWIAAQRLAAGDTLRLAAVMANTNVAVLNLLMAADLDFAGLIEDCRAIHQMSRDAWRARAEAYARDAAERAMVDGRVSTVNLLLKTTGLLTDTSADADDDPDASMEGRADEALAEYEPLGDDKAEWKQPPRAATEAVAVTVAVAGPTPAEAATPVAAEASHAISSQPVPTGVAAPTSGTAAPVRASLTPSGNAAPRTDFSLFAFPKAAVDPCRLAANAPCVLPAPHAGRMKHWAACRRQLLALSSCDGGAILT